MTPRMLAVAAACLSIVQTQAPTFRGGIEKVRVDVLVAVDGKPVTDLRLSDFEILDNGVPQRIEGYGAFEDIPLNIVLALDTSSSVTGKRAQLLRGACHDLLAELKEDDQAALVVFGDAIIVRSRLSRDFAAVRAAIDRPFPVGQTSLIDAAQAGILLAESGPGRALVLVFSDGLEVSSYLPPDTVLETVKRSDAVIYGVVLRGVPRPPFITELAEGSGGTLLETASPTDIAPAFKRVLEEFRHRYLLSYTPTGVNRAGWHSLKVRVKRQGITVKARPGYLAK